MTTPVKGPSCGEVEQVALEYQTLERRIEAIVKKAEEELAPLQAQLTEHRNWFIEKVREFGSAHAEKSKILHGIGMEAMVTFGQSSSIDAAAVEAFRLALVKADRRVLLQRIFERTVRWTLLPDASAFIREHGDRLGAKLLGLYSRCQVTKERTPQLTVRAKEKAAA
jgi:hypothetical protein